MQLAVLKQMFYRLLVIPAWAHVCLANFQFPVQVVIESAVADSESENCHLVSSWQGVVGVSYIRLWEFFVPFFIEAVL